MIKKILRYGLIALIAIISTGWSLPVRADDNGNKEYLVKAAFIYNFVKFIEWPDGMAVGAHANINVCVIGDSPMSKTADIFKAASTPKLSLSLVVEKNWKDAPAHCHILFISESEEGKVNEIIDGLKDKPVLTVSDIDGFADHGGMIGFVTDDNHIKLVINAHAITAAGMKVDAQLLEIALKVL